MRNGGRVNRCSGEGRARAHTHTHRSGGHRPSRERWPGRGPTPAAVDGAVARGTVNSRVRPTSYTYVYYILYAYIKNVRGRAIGRARWTAAVVTSALARRIARGISGDRRDPKTLRAGGGEMQKFAWVSSDIILYYYYTRARERSSSFLGGTRSRRRRILTDIFDRHVGTGAARGREISIRFATLCDIYVGI